MASTPSSSPRISLILVWLGPWRPWISLTLSSFARNQHFTLNLVAPQPPPSQLAPGIRFHEFTTDEVSRRISKLLDQRWNLSRPYKLCDFKPSYAHLFPELVVGYSHWGWCDEDVIWGDLDGLVLPILNADPDIVASCRSCISGQFAILRNGEKTNSLYRKIPSWKEKLLDQASNYVMDEQPLNQAALELEKRSELNVRRLQLQTHDVNSPEWNAWADRLELEETGKPYGEFKHGEAIWRDGRILHAASGQEFAFFHFGHWKRRWVLPHLPPPPAEVNEWRFSADGIKFDAAPRSGPAGKAYIARYRRARLAACAVHGLVSSGQAVTRSFERLSRRIRRAATTQTRDNRG